MTDPADKIERSAKVIGGAIYDALVGIGVCVVIALIFTSLNDWTDSAALVFFAAFLSALRARATNIEEKHGD